MKGKTYLGKKKLKFTKKGATC